MKRRNVISKKFSAKEYVQKGFYENSKNIGNILAKKYCKCIACNYWLDNRSVVYY